jgi:hypothetical protein
MIVYTEEQQKGFAATWWRTLSTNEMKAFEKKHKILFERALPHEVLAIWKIEAKGKPIKSFVSKCIPFGKTEYDNPVRQDFNETHAAEANPHLIYHTDFYEGKGISLEAAIYLIGKWNRTGNPKYVYSL